MKKILSFVICTMLIFTAMLTGCSKPTNANNDKKKIKVGFIYVGPVGDGGYTYAHDQGRKYLEKELGIETTYKENIPEEISKVEECCKSFIDEGCNVIIGTSFGFMDGMEKVSKEYPDVKFMHCSGFKTTDNMSNYFGRIHQAEYLAGIVAGMKTKTNKIGFVGAYSIPEVVRNINAFTLGAQSVNKDVKVIVTWTHTWYDPAKESEAAKYLLNEKGVDVIMQHQDTAGPQQAAEAKGAASIGYNTDMSSMAPKANMTSVIWNWGPFYVDQIKAIQNGTWKAESLWPGMTNDANSIVNLAPLTANAPAGAKEKVDAAKADIVSGKNKIFVGPLKDNTGAVKVAAGAEMTDKDLLGFDWLVEGVEGKIEK